MNTVISCIMVAYLRSNSNGTQAIREFKISWVSTSPNIG